MESTSKTTDFLSILVRSLGLLMLIIGLYIGIKVIFEAWTLYDEPQRIERLADAIDNGSHLDKALASITSNALDIKPNDDTVRSQLANNTDDSLRVSYFLAWFLAVLLLLIISGLAMSAIKTGGQLALYDLEVKRFARQLIEEARKTDND